MNGGFPVDLSEATSAAWIGTKSDGKIICNACKIKDNKIHLQLSLQMTTAEGKLKGHIEVNFPNGVLKFYGVNFNVFPSEETNKIESTDEFTMLEKAIAQAKNAYQIAVENGFTGTETEWLASLKGDRGDTGEKGDKGERGQDGTDYVLTESDKSEIADIVISKFDEQLMSVLGGDESVTE